jgi:two-component system NarL family sensor kinase
VTLAPTLAAVPRIRVTTAPAVVLGLALVAVLGALALDLGNTAADRDRALMGFGWLTGCVGVLLVGCAAPVLHRIPRHRVAWGRLVGQPGQLLVEITDDGRGIDPEVPAGVGLRSTRERAGELGGRTEIVCPASAGTRVRAWLPVSTSQEERTS